MIQTYPNELIFILSNVGDEEFNEMYESFMKTISLKYGLIHSVMKNVVIYFKNEKSLYLKVL